MDYAAGARHLRRLVQYFILAKKADAFFTPGNYYRIQTELSAQALCLFG